MVRLDSALRLVSRWKRVLNNPNYNLATMAVVSIPKREGEREAREKEERICCDGETQYLRKTDFPRIHQDRRRPHAGDSESFA